MGSDYDCDGDVDGVDLVEVILDSGGLAVNAFAANFGKVD
jgi:hypothetical protein